MSYMKYDKEFKLNAVKLVIDGGRTVADVSRSLGISSNVLYRWKNAYLEDKEVAFPGKGHLKPEDERMRQLEKELADVKMERDILKKAVAIFSKDRK